MSKEDIANHAKTYSQAYSSSYSPWSKNFDEMAKKTVLKKVLKYAPIKVEFVKQIVQDSTIKTEINSDMTEVESQNVFEAEETDYEVIDQEETK